MNCCPVPLRAATPPKSSRGLVQPDAFGVSDEVFIYPHLPTVGVHRHIDDFGLRDFDTLRSSAVALGFDDDAHGDRGRADALGGGVKADEVADIDGLVEDDLAHGYGDE